MKKPGYALLTRLGGLNILRPKIRQGGKVYEQEGL